MSCFTSDPIAAYHMDCDARDANTERPAPGPPSELTDEAAFRVLLEIWQRDWAAQNPDPVEVPF